MPTLEAPALDRYLLVGLGVVLAAVVFLLLRRNARVAAVVWLVAVCFVPVWLGLNIGPYWPPAALAGLGVILALLPVPGWRIGTVDVVIIALNGLYVVSLVLKSVTIDAGFVLVFTWTAGYVLGRAVALRVGLVWLYRAVSIVFSVVAVLAILEFVMHWNPFVQISAGNSFLYQVWGTLQERGGIVRAEGAFGHSIALGASLALVMPMVLVNGFRLWIRLGMVGVMLLATVLTFSRAGMICAALSIIGSLVFVRGIMSLKAKLLVVGVIAAISAAILPFVGDVFTAAGDEAVGSADYRGDLVSLVADMNVIGVSPSMTRLPNGDVYFGSFHSIDSALILFGLTYGLLPLVLALALLVAGVIVLLRGRGNAPLVGVIAQIPALMTVALITQYSMLFWFVFGVSVTAYALRSGQDPQTQQNNTRMTESTSVEPQPEAVTRGIEAGVHGGS
ncbi:MULTISPECIES: hypothetical protein [unclassified Plantibacter]|uniref:hypothetical protein n=1 Tax=unclassified Plantibacter TaxID=2624265 RepID=UPI003D3551D0